MAYLLDANVFIEAHQRYYGFDLCPGFWDWVAAAHAAGRVLSIAKVGDELKAGADSLAAWAERQPSSFFAPMDAALLASLAEIAQWARRQSYRSDAIARFLEDADYYLVAFAHAHGHIVVTHEKPSDGVRRVKIPNVALGINLPYINTFEMLRRERARFVLGAGA
ncbi:MAG: DUF4411 family protein [Bryobacteraceae bacterium]|nr:DUF4411 family protein [Bryobacteraceae bacterium]